MEDSEEAIIIKTPWEEQQQILQERQQREHVIARHNSDAGMVKCSNCGGWFYDEPGNFCSCP